MQTDSSTGRAGPLRDRGETGTMAGVSDLLSAARRRLGLILAVAATTILAAAAYLLLATPLYRATVDVLVDPQTLQIVGRGVTRSDTSPSIDFANIDSQVAVLTSTAILRDVIGELDLADDPAFRRKAVTPGDAALLDALRERLVVRRVDNSLVFQVTASHPDAARAAAIANALAAAYLRQSSVQRTGIVRRAGSTLLDQLAALRDQLNAADAAVERFKAEQGLVSTGEAGLMVTQQLKELSTQIGAATAELSRIAARQDRVRGRSIDQIMTDATPEALLSPVIGSLRSQYARLVEEEAQLSRSLGANHPQLAAARTQRDAIRKLIAGEIDRTRRAMEEEARRAGENLATLKRRLAELVASQTSSREAEIRLRQLESEADSVRSVYNAALSRSKELDQQGGLETNNSRVISEAVPPARPSGAPKLLVLAAASVFGTVLGLVLAFGLDLLTGVLTSGAAMAGAVGLPVVATLNGARGPTAPGGEDPAADDRMALLRAARAMRRDLAPRLPALVLVTGPGEAGERTYLADTLAKVLRELGETVLRCSQFADERSPDPVNLRAAPAVPAVPASGERPAPSPGTSLLPADRSEIVVVDVDPGDADALMSAVEAADAILIAARPGHVRRAALQRLVATFDDPREERLALFGLVAIRDPARRPARRPGIAGAARGFRPKPARRAASMSRA